MNFDQIGLVLAGSQKVSHGDGVKFLPTLWRCKGKQILKKGLEPNFDKLKYLNSYLVHYRIRAVCRQSEKMCIAYRVPFSPFHQNVVAAFRSQATEFCGRILSQNILSQNTLSQNSPLMVKKYL